VVSEKEMIWWNKFSRIMEKHWALTPALNNIIRNEYYRDYENYLFKENGKFLDIGCGTGWVGHNFAEQGMYVDGIDFSEEQIKAARDAAGKKGLKQIKFFCRDIVNESIIGRFDNYDSVIINACLHHLSKEEMKEVLGKIYNILNENGKLYIYEPLIPKKDSILKFYLLSMIDFPIRVVFFTLKKVLIFLGPLDVEFKEAIRQGYTGASPDEKAIDLDFLRKICEENNLKFVELIPFHNLNLTFSMNIMMVAEPFRTYIQRFVTLFHWFDKCLFKIYGWNNFSSFGLKNMRSILCGIKFHKLTGK